MVKLLHNVALKKSAEKYTGDLNKCKDFLEANLVRAKFADGKTIYKKNKFVFVEIYRHRDEKKCIEYLIRACFLIKNHEVLWLKIEKGIRMTKK